MKKLFCAAAAVAVALSVPTQAVAQLGGEATGGKAEGQWGGELGVGYSFRFGPISVRPIGGAFIYKGNNDRYYNQTMSNGETRCRDRSNGQFAKDAKCNDVAAMFYGKLEATVSIPMFAEVGVGGRFMDGEVRPYGLVSVPLAPKVRIVGAGGQEYFSLGVRLGF